MPRPKRKKPVTRKKSIRTLADLTPDPRNANRGTERGRGMLEHSMSQLGAGRSILVDKHGNVIAGNKALEVAAALKIPIEIVETDGTRLVVVKRMDLDLKTDAGAVALGLADNRTSEVGLDWDVEVLANLAEEGVDLDEWWFGDELAELLGEDTPPPEPPEPKTASETTCPACGHTWTEGE